MLIKIKTKPKKFSQYKKIIHQPLYEEVLKLAKNLKGIRVAHLNATAGVGGVSEVIRSLAPLMNSVGLKTDWFILPSNNQFFTITKEFHNSLQGKKWKLSQRNKKFYLDYLKKAAKGFPADKYDVLVFHDPQTLALIDFLDVNKTIWRCHVDTQKPNRQVWNFLIQYIKKYDKVIFSLKEYSGHAVVRSKIRIVPPAIDALSVKNKKYPGKKARRVILQCGLNIDRPIITQISRFDPWKDPIGVIKAYRLAKKSIAGLQMAYIGFNLTKDDPEAARIYKKTKKAAGNDKDIHLFFDQKDLGDLNIDQFIAAFQTGSDIILQKSIVEGFGLTVTEGMWKGKPVIGGKVGGIKLQIKNGQNGFLVTNPEDCAKTIVRLFKNPKEAKRVSQSAKESVRTNYLMPRLLRDYLKIMVEIL